MVIEDHVGRQPRTHYRATANDFPCPVHAHEQQITSPQPVGLGILVADEATAPIRNIDHAAGYIGNSQDDWPMWIAPGLRRSTSDQRPQAERWHSSMTITEKASSA